MSPMSPRLLRPLARRQAPAPAPTDPLFSQVKLLLHMDGADAATTFTDSSSSPLTVVGYGDAQIDSEEPKFGTGAALFDGNGDYLEVAVSTVPRFGVGGTPYTVEMWVWCDSEGLAIFTVRWGGVDDWSSADGIQWQLFAVGGTLYLNFATSGGPQTLTAGSFPSEAWTHVAIAYDGTTTRLFVDGAEKDSTSAAYGDRADANTLQLGRQGSQYDFSKWIDEFRITQGATGCRYTANFTPPTAPFPSQ